MGGPTQRQAVNRGMYIRGELEVESTRINFQFHEKQHIAWVIADLNDFCLMKDTYLL